MDDNKNDERLSENAGGVEETKGAAVASTRRQIAKYVIIWLGIVGLFLVFNTVIKSMATTNAASEQANSNGYYSSGQPVAGYAAGAAGSSQLGAGSGNCGAGGACCETGTQSQVGQNQAGATGSNAGSTGASSAAGSTAQSSTGQAAVSDQDRIAKAAIDWYAQKSGDNNVTAEVQDFGCHQQITLKKNGKTVAEISYRGGEFQSLTP